MLPAPSETFGSSLQVMVRSSKEDFFLGQLPNIHEKIIQTVQFHQKKTEKATETGDRARGSAHYQKGLLLLFSLNCMFIIIKTRS